MSEENTKYYLVYQIENKLNGMIYIGCHVTTNIKDKYMGSGTNIRKAIKKYGLENFNKSILYCFDNEKEMLDKEAELVNKQFISNINTYNICIGGGKLNALNNVIVKDKNGDNLMVHKNDERYLSGELISIHKNKVAVKDIDGNTMQVDKTDERYLSSELVGITKDKILINYNDIFFYVDKNDPRYLSGELKHLWTDKKHSEETKKKMSQSSKGMCVGEKNGSFGTCWITKDNENKKIKKVELEQYINIGWVKGRKIK